MWLKRDQRGRYHSDGDPVALCLPQIIYAAPLTRLQRSLWSSIAFALEWGVLLVIFLARELITTRILVGLALLELFPVAGFVAYTLERRRAT